MRAVAKNHIVVPRQRGRRYYGHGIPGVDLGEMAGKLIVVEGADGSGRSTQIARLVEWLEGGGHATVQVGLKRSTLVSEELEQAQHGNILSRTTLSLFYATDFADQLENIILPALKHKIIELRGAVKILLRHVIFANEVELVNMIGFQKWQEFYDFAQNRSIFLVPKF